MQAANNDLGDYRAFLQSFLNAGYQPVRFKELSNETGQWILRHDIDFDTNFALQCAEIEKELGIQATYFFLLRSHFYNVFTPRDYNNITRIRDMGHCISVHFDPTLYEDFHAGLRQEVSLFTQLFGSNVHVISLHRPNEFFQNFNEPIFGIEHTYQSKYFKDAKYFSDSTGVWRFGSPLLSPEFQRRKSLHVLIHPVWWMVQGSDNKEKLRKYYLQRSEELKKEFCANCLPFRDIYDQL